MTDIHMRDLGAKSHLDALLATVGAVDGLRVIDIGCGEGRRRLRPGVGCFEQSE